MEVGPSDVFLQKDGFRKPAAEALAINGDDDEGSSESVSSLLIKFADIVLRAEE